MNKTLISTAALAGLQSGEFASLGLIDLSAAPNARDILVELGVTPGQTAGHREVMLFARVSLDGITWTSGPASGFSSVDVPNLYHIDPVPLNSPGVPQRRVFSLQRRIGFLPPHVELIARNMTGEVLPAEGHDAAYVMLT